MPGTRDVFDYRWSMSKLLCVVIGAGLLAGCGRPTETPKIAAAPGSTPTLSPVSGVDSQYIDDTVRAQDDFYQYVNGKWLARTEIPADKSSYDPWDELTDETQIQLRGIVEGLQKTAALADPEQRKIADLYASFMDEPALEQLSTAPLDAEFARIEGLADKTAIPSLIAHFNRIGITAPYTPRVHQDAKDSTKHVFDLGQDGLGLPDRDYYLQNDARLEEVRSKYGQHIEKMLTLAKDLNAARNARDILTLERALAAVQWTKVQNRDPVKTYNKVEFAKLARLAPGYDWTVYLRDCGVIGRTDSLIISQPSYITGFNRILRTTPLPVWKAYFRWHLLSDFAPYLNKDFADEHFAFYGTALRGIEQNEPRWKRGIELIDRSIGEELGKLYVAKYFPPESKVRMERLVRNLLEAYKADIDALEWMDPATRQRAQEKLAKFNTKIGYPDKWRDYRALQVTKGDLVGNVMRAQVFEYNRNLNKLGQPIDRTEWEMTPQTLNAYYEPERNEIVFPAAILHPPSFNFNADDAVNYGAIGGVIGHEISHGFDDEGSQYDGDGNLLSPPGWFTKADLDRFKARTRALVTQYAAYSPVPGFPINGELTLGENIADNSGLAIAYKAYRLSLGAGDAPVIDGLTGDQRFFMGWAQFWRCKTRENQAILWIKADPHSPEQFRGMLPEMNQTEFNGAFGIKPGDKMYLAPEDRVHLW
jgi:putative endopeptidase